MSMVQYGLGMTGSTPGSGAVNYHNPFTNAGTWSTSTTLTRALLPQAGGGTISGLTVNLTTAPGAGTSWQFDILLNGTTVLTTVTISGTSTTGTDVGVGGSFSQFDKIQLRSTPTGTPAGTGAIEWSFAMTTSDNVSMVSSHTRTAPTYTGSLFAGLNVGASATIFTATAADYEAPVPTAGTFKNAGFELTAAPTSGSLTITLFVNGVATALAPSTSATSGRDTTNSVSVSAGDVVYWSVTWSGTPGATVPSTISVEFDPVTNGESILLNGCPTATSTTSTQFNFPAGSTQTYSGTESTRQAVSGGATWYNFYVLLTTAPGVGTSIVHSIRKNASATGAISVTIADTATTGSNTSTQLTSVAGDLFSMRYVPTTTPAATQIKFGLVQFVPPTSSVLVSEWISPIEQPYPDKTYVVSY